MGKVYVGKIVSTHGIKGEVKILSDFEYKDKVFKKDFKIYIGKNHEEAIINTYRHHKIYDMVTLLGIDNINDVLKYKGMSVYINKSDIKIDGYFNEDIIGLNAYSCDKKIGEVSDILKSKAHDILVINDNDKKYMVPKIDEFILKVDLENKKIFINEIKGLFE